MPLYKIQHWHGPVLTRLLAQEPQNRAQKKWSRRRATAWRSWRCPTLAMSQLQTPTLVYLLLPLPQSVPVLPQSVPVLLRASRASQSSQSQNSVEIPDASHDPATDPCPGLPSPTQSTRAPVLPQSQNPFPVKTRPQETVPQTPVRLSEPGGPGQGLETWGLRLPHPESAARLHRHGNQGRGLR